jgi:hypothetical protein
MHVQGRAVDAGHDLDASLLDPTQGQDTVGDTLQAIRATANDNHLQAQVVVDVDVQGGAHLFAQLVLQVGQSFAEVAHVMVVDHGQGCDGIDRRRHLGATDGGPCQVAEQLRPRAAAFAYHGVEVAKQRAFQCDTKTNQGIFHHGESSAPPFGRECRRVFRPRLGTRAEPALTWARRDGGSSGRLTLRGLKSPRKSAPLFAPAR